MKRFFYIIGIISVLIAALILISQSEKSEKWVNFDGSNKVVIATNKISASITILDDYSGEEKIIEKHFEIVDIHSFNDITTMYFLFEIELKEWAYLIKKQRGEKVCLISVYDLAYPYCDTKECLYKMKENMIKYETAPAHEIFQLND